MYALNSLGIQNPLPIDAGSVQSMISGNGGASGALSGAYNTLMSVNRVAGTADGTFRGQEMAANAGSIAGMQALAQQTYQANAQRLQQLASLRQRMGTASDPAEVSQMKMGLAATEADLHAQQGQLQSAQLMFISAQASRGQRAAENEDRCLRIVVAYFQSGGGTLKCPSGAQGGAVTQNISTNIGTVGGTGGASGPLDGTALDTMMAQSWGDAAAANAQKAGITPEALAATCVIESGCQSVSSSSSTAGGPFQIINSTYQSTAAQIGVSTDLSGKMDGATSSAVAATYLAQQGQKLQQYGIDTPTVGQARALYQFGGAGMGLATAPDSAVISNVMPGVSATTLSQNGIVPGVTTAGDWRAKGRSVAGSAFDARLFPASNT